MVIHYMYRNCGLPILFHFMKSLQLIYVTLITNVVGVVYNEVSLATKKETSSLLPAPECNDHHTLLTPMRT